MGTVAISREKGLQNRCVVPWGKVAAVIHTEPRRKTHEPSKSSVCPMALSSPMTHSADPGDTATASCLLISASAPGMCCVDACAAPRQTLCGQRPPLCGGPRGSNRITGAACPAQRLCLQHITPRAGGGVGPVRMRVDRCAPPPPRVCPPSALRGLPVIAHLTVCPAGAYRAS